MEKESPLEQLEELYLIANWAIYYGYTDITQKTLEEIVSRGGTIGRNSPLEKRLTFHGYICAVNALKLDDSLNFLDELDIFFSKDCQGDQTSPFYWLKIRQSIVRQTAIQRLKDILKIGNQLPQFPKDIKVPKTFSFKKFKENIEELFEKTRKYDGSADLGKIEDYFIHKAKSLLFQPFDSSPIDKDALHFLFHLFTTNVFRTEAISFAKSVEREVVLGAPPEFFSPHSTPSESKNVDSVPDWKDDDRGKIGPYVATSQTDESSEFQNLDGNDTDEQNEIQSNPREQEDLIDTSTSSVVRNLHKKRDQFTQNNLNHDPLLEATGLTEVMPVVSHAGKLHSNSEAPKKKQRLIDGRDSASEVVWNESEEEEVPEIPESSSKLTIENVQKQKFQPQLSKSKGSRQSIGSPSGQSIVERDKGVRLAWTKDEEDALIAGVSIYGVGNWIQILQDPNLSYRFRGRTNVNLKDKYRNLSCS